MRRITPDGDEVIQKIYLRSGADDLFPGDDIAEAIDQGINRLTENLTTFESQGSGWTLVAVDRLEVSTAQFLPNRRVLLHSNAGENRQLADLSQY